jgi:hypothetical protein
MNNTRQPPKPEPEPWKKSKAKKQLRKDIIDGIVTDKSKPQHVYQMNPMYLEYPYDNFRTNLLALKKKVKTERASAVYAIEAIQYDRLRFPRPLTKANGEPLWNGSVAEMLLREEVKKEDISQITKKPKEWWNSNAEYQRFSLDTFRDHLKQERRAKTYNAYWEYIKMKEKKK